MKFFNSKTISLFAVILFCIAYCSSCSTMAGMPKSVLVEPKQVNSPEEDSVTIIATKRYDCGIIKPVFQGSNYRTAWSTPIRVPVIDLRTYKGGMKPIEKGGGLQTLSMDLQGPDGIIYTLRSVNKNPEDAVPKFAKNNKLKNIVMDAMSAQHPYGAIVVAKLAESVGILHTNPEIVFVPHQEALDTFNNLFGNQLFLLEYEPEGSGAWVEMENVIKIIDTEDVQKMLLEFPDSKVDDRAVIRARLFDLMIGDWDRHSKQWGWVVTEKDDQITYTPLPTDRDNAFYNPGGLIPWVITRPGITPFLRPFKKKIDHVPGMTTAFDQFFLLDVPEELFTEVALELQKDFTDEKIEAAFEVWPDEFYEIDGEDMIEKIKSRRDKLPKYALKFKKAVEDRGPLTKPLKGSSKLYVKK